MSYATGTPSIEELAPSYPAAKFCTVRADRVGLDEVSRENDVKQFPTVLVMRGEREVGRVVGHERCAVRLTQLLRQQITAEDMEFQAARRQQEIEDAGGAGEEEEEEEDLQWTWDPEYASDDIRTLQYGTVVAMVKQEEEDGLALEAQYVYSGQKLQYTEARKKQMRETLVKDKGATYTYSNDFQSLAVEMVDEDRPPAATGGHVVNICLSEVTNSQYFVSFLGLRWIHWGQLRKQLYFPPTTTTA